MFEGLEKINELSDDFHNNIIITSLNHASLSITYRNEFCIIFDPWFSGYTFGEGWGLNYHNSDALGEVSKANYLWISHLHNDHFHYETLKSILKINPDINILCNESVNFSVYEILKRVGFKKLIKLYERRELIISNGIKIIRYPSTGIDNMLLMDFNGTRILNYNDCNLPSNARKLLKKKFGRIDILLNNFNHAGKIIEYPLPRKSQIQKELKSLFMSTIVDFKPTYTIPFASFHHYRSSESQDLNESLLTIKEIVSIFPNILPLSVGSSLKLSNDNLNYKIIDSNNITKVNRTIKVRESIYSLKDLSKASSGFIKRLRKSFFGIGFLNPPLFIYVYDLDEYIFLSLRSNQLKILDSKVNCHISVHSSELFSWWTKPFGTDCFIVGGHFEINKRSILPLKNILLMSILLDNKLDLLSLISYFFSLKGWLFFINRREEIFSILTSLNFKIGSRN